MENQMIEINIAKLTSGQIDATTVDLLRNADWKQRKGTPRKWAKTKFKRSLEALQLPGGWR